MRSKRGNLFVVSAPSGAGKTTLCQRLSDKMGDIKHSVSYTTRKPRPGEVGDRDYSFVSEADFMKMVEAGEFAEWAKVHGNFYGTSGKRLTEMLEAGTDVILDIDVQGAEKIKDSHPEAVFVFVLPPSMEVLRGRLTGRMSDSERAINDRLRRALGEISVYKNYDYVIVNDAFEKALAELEAIVTASRARSGRIDPEWVRKNFSGPEE